jgi:hypothetical protein
MATITGNVGCFTFASWLEHMRQHECMTATDRDIEAQAWVCQQGEHLPVVTHFVAAPRPHVLRGGM